MRIGLKSATSFSLLVLATAADAKPLFPQSVWCDDPLTTCREGYPDWIPGLRLTVDAPLGVVIVPGAETKPDLRGSLGGTLGIYRALASVQAGLLFGGAIDYSDDSKYLLKDPGGTAPVTLGFTLGGCLLADSACIGVGIAALEGTAFETDATLTRGWFWYVNIQPGSIARYFAQQ